MTSLTPHNALANPKTISVIVPVLNELATIKSHIKHYQQLRESVLEVIFVDGGSTDGGDSELERKHFTVLKSARGRALQMNTGAQVASGDILAFLHADTRLPETFPHCLAHFDGRWGFFLLRLRSTRRIFRWVEWGICMRSKIFGVGTGDQCLFFDRDEFVAQQGFANIPLMEDIEIARRFKRLQTAYIVDSPVNTSARRWEKHGVVKTVLTMWWLQCLYRLGVEPVILHKKYYGE